MNFLFKIILLISKLPLKIQYFFSDIIFFIAFYMVGYRKNTINENIRNSFPGKSKEEIRKIVKQFYRNFSDYLVETVRSFTISSKELRVRVQHINQQVFHDAKKEGKNVIMLAGHIFNWEWYNALATVIPQKNCHPVYRKVNNSFWEEKIKNIRNSYGNQALEANEVIRHIFKTPNDGNSAYMFVADQTPHFSDVSYGIKFLHQKTPAFIGYDKLATRLDFVFVYCEMKRVKRGYYQVNYYRIFPEKEKFTQYEVVRKFHHFLENTIHKYPSNYLWSHRKWKYKDFVKMYDDTPY